MAGVGGVVGLGVEVGARVCVWGDRQTHRKTEKSDSISDTVVARTGLSIDSSFSTGGVNPAGPISLKKDLDSNKFILPPWKFLFSRPIR